MQEAIEVDIKELLLVLLRNLKWIFLCMVLGGAGAYCATWLLVTPEYSSSVSLYVNNNNQGEIAAAMNINDINASQKLVNTYIVILQDDEVMERVAGRLTEEFDRSSLENSLSLEPKELRKVIRMSAVNNTEVLRIEAQTPNAALSARICTLMTEIAPEILQRVVKAGSVEVIGEARAAESPSYPNFRVNCALGAFAGLLLSAVLILLNSVMDNSIKDEEDLKNRFDVPVLGEIPDFETSSNKEGAYEEYGYH